MQRSNKLRRSSVRLILIRTSNPIYRDIYIYPLSGLLETSSKKNFIRERRSVSIARILNYRKVFRISGRDSSEWLVRRLHRVLWFVISV